MLSLLYYIFTITLSLFLMAVSLVALIICYPFDPKRHVVHVITRILMRIFFFIPPLWKHKVIGGEHLDPKKKYVVVVNHQNMMDIPALYFLNFDYRWVSKKEVFWSPLFGQYMVLHNDIAIERGNPRKAMAKVIEQGKKWLAMGVSITIFPEGTRSKTGEIGRFKAGAFTLAKEADVEILPVVMDGTKSVIRPNLLFDWRNEITLHILPPVSREQIAEQDPKEVMEQVQADMIEALKNIRNK